MRERTAKSIFNTWLNGYKSKNTKAQYERILTNFFEMTLGKNTKDIQPEDIAIFSDVGGMDLVSDNYTHIYRNAGKSDGTIGTYLSVVRSFITQLQDNMYGRELGIDYDYICNKVLSSKGFKSRSEELPSVLSFGRYEELTQWFLDYPFSKRYKEKGEQYAVALQFMYITGVRVDATFGNLRWNNIKREEDAFGNEAWVVYVLDKGDRIGRSPIADEFYNKLRSIMYSSSDDDLVFSKISKQMFANYMMEFSKEKKIDILTPHSIRRGAATKLYMMTKDPIKVQHFLGHADLKRTMRYIRTNDNMAESGSYILSSRISIDNVKNIRPDRLVKIIMARPELAYAVLSEDKRMGD